MKTQAVPVILALFALTLGGANGQDAFLVSNIREDEDWCITATNGVSDGSNLGFRLCDFNGAPSNQLWKLDQGKIYSAVDPAQCMIVNYGGSVFDGVRVRMAICTTDTIINQFTHNGATDQLRSTSNRGYCLTNRGVTPNDSDTIHMKPCESSGRYRFTYRLQNAPNTAPPSTASPAGVEGLVLFTTGDGCLTVRDSEARNDQKLMLESCNQANQRWDSDDNGLIRTELDNTMCMQGGRGEPQMGTMMRIFTCDSNNALQKFESIVDNQGAGEKIRLQGTTLCVDHRGVIANVNEDPIILKSCNEAGSWNDATEPDTPAPDTTPPSTTPLDTPAPSTAAPI